MYVMNPYTKHFFPLRAIACFFPSVSLGLWMRKGDASSWQIAYKGFLLFELLTTADEFLGGRDVQSILECGLIPTFDR